MTGSILNSPELRPLRQSDTPAVLAAFLSNPDMRRQGDVSSPETAAAYVTHLLHSDGPHRAFAVVTGDELVGLVAVTMDAKNRNGWFWYWMREGSRGRGWTTCAAATIANWALTAGRLERLALGHRANNPASESVARAAGFIHEGTEREKFLVDGQRIDVLTYSRLRSDAVPTTTELAWQHV
ncbi:GNAT family N-acetyltransferase [Tessaracoccus antarcticus]|uniref:N-acetyltransferase n=1 Tax=Tessaracoccus antarcticus TaxID=2479848 RepID=A0A3M0G2N7_9ACTN|nr:GNAT family protein [Tessaracoccus antarcticus]RMB59025.1 N-acetyltransferase [Tessaracoccus antarcticus]